MKTRFNNSEVCHVWASQQQEHGRSGNIFFEGRSIFSYGRHFEMARFITDEVVFITTRGYSVTTSGHLSTLRRAVSHLRTFTVPSFTDHNENLAYLIKEATDKIENVKRKRNSRSIDWLLEDFNTDDITQYAFVFGLQLPELPTITPELRAELSEKAARYRIKEGEANQRREAEREKARAFRMQEETVALAEWKQGTGYSRYFETTALRVNGNEVETTHGARVTLQDARRFYEALRAGIDLTGARVGMFTVQSVTEELAVIGCHKIPMSEIKRIEPMVMERFATLPMIGA